MNVNAVYGLFFLRKHLIMVTKWNANVTSLDNVEVQFSSGSLKGKGR